MPLIVICMRSKSETIKALAFEMSHIMCFLLRDEKKKFNNLCVFITDEAIPTQLLEQFFVQLGDQNLHLAGDVVTF